MDDAFFMRGFERVGDLTDDVEGFFERDRTFFYALSERLPLDQFHDEVVRTDVEQRADIGMIQRGDGSGFAFESFAEPFRRRLDRYVATDPGVMGAIHLAHATLADRCNDFIMPEFVAC